MYIRPWNIDVVDLRKASVVRGVTLNTWKPLPIRSTSPTLIFWNGVILLTRKDLMRSKRHRWRIERTNVWLQSYGHISNRKDRRAIVFLGRAQLAFLFAILKRFLLELLDDFRGIASTHSMGPIFWSSRT